MGFVRGCKAFPIPAGGHTSALMHSTDWLPTICGLAGAKTDRTLTLDGYDQWKTLSAGDPTPRTTIFHNVPVGAAPVAFVDPKTNKTSYNTSACLFHVDNRTGPCHGFGLTGGAIRKNEWKLLTTYPGSHPWEDSAPEGVPQYPPGGAFPNGSRVFAPSTNDSLPVVFPINSTLGVFLFNVSADPTETHNLAASESAVLADMLETYSQYAVTAVMPLTFRYGFRDPMSGNSLPRPNEPHCQGQFGGSAYCAYGHEFDCMVMGRRMRGRGSSAGPTSAADASECHAACKKASGCEWWSFSSGDEPATAAAAAAGPGEAGEAGCRFFWQNEHVFTECDSPAACAYGPADCDYGWPSHSPFPGPVEPPQPPHPPPCNNPSTACFVKNKGLSGGDLVNVKAASDAECQKACQAHPDCSWWVQAHSGSLCRLKSSKGAEWSGGIDHGPRCCPVRLLTDDIADTFSWSLDGGRTIADLNNWKRTVSTDAASKNTTLTRGDTTAVVSQRFLGAGAVETLIRFAHAAQAVAPSPMLSNISSLDLIIPVPAGATATLHGFLGSSGSSDDFSSFSKPLDAPLVFRPIGGRSSNGLLGYFGVHVNDSAANYSKGLVLSVGWTGTWRARFERVLTGIRVTVGLSKFRAALFAGERFRAARVLAVNYSGADVFDGFNAHRKMLARHYLRKNKTTGKLRGAIISSWTAQFYHNDVTAQNMLAMTAGVKAGGVENAWIDFGWYKNAACATGTKAACKENGGLGDVGNWLMPPVESVDATSFPRPLSLKAVADAAHAGTSHTKFTVWFEPESVCSICALGIGNRSAAFAKGWALNAGGARCRPYDARCRLLLDLGNEGARKYMTAYLSDAIPAFGLDILRMDFNQDPQAQWVLKDQLVAAASKRPLRQGMAEVKYVEGLYSMWSDVISAHPQVLLDNCASGGRRIDLETSMRSTPLWQSDLAGNKGDVSESWQSQNAGLSAFLPIHSGGCPRLDGHTTSGPSGQPGLTVECEPYVWRSCGGAIGKAIAWPAATWASVAANSTMAARVRLAVAETQRLRSISTDVDANYWPLVMPINPTSNFLASQHSLGDECGFALIFRRPAQAASSFVRSVPNRSDFTLELTAPKPDEGYFAGEYNVSLAKDVTELGPCKARCATSAACEGLTFVAGGGPPCVLYSTIAASKTFSKSAKVTQYAKAFVGSQIYVLSGTGKTSKHALPQPAGVPFLEPCGKSFVPACCANSSLGACVSCAELAAAPDGGAGCGPYAGGQSKPFEPKLRGLDRSASYSVSLYEDKYVVTKQLTMSGAALATISLSLRPRSSVLLEYEKKSLGQSNE